MGQCISWILSPLSVPPDKHIAKDLIQTVSQVKASLALEQKRVSALRGALAETEASDSGHSGGECESTSGDSSLEQVVL